MGLYSLAMKRGPFLIGLAAFAAIAAIIAWPTVRIASALDGGRASARAAFDELRREALNEVSGPAAAGGKAWGDKAAALWRAEPRLLAVVIKDGGGRVLYALPSASPYYRRLAQGLDFDRPERVTEAFSGTLSAGLSIDALFVTLSQEALFLPFRDSLVASLVALAVLLSALAATSRKQTSGAPAYERERDSEPERRRRESESSLYAEEPFATIARPGSEQPPAAPSPSAAPEAAGAAAPEPPRAAADGVGIVRQADLPAGALDGPRGLFDPDSGLGWEAYLRDRLGAELRRSASFEQDLSLLLCELDGSVRGDEDFSLFATRVRDYFGFKDMAFLFQENGVMCVLPNVDVDHALRMSGELRKKLRFVFQGRGDPGIHMGLSSRAGRLVDADRLIGESMAAIGKAKAEPGTSIMAFRPDPEKFRAYLAGQ